MFEVALLYPDKQQGAANRYGMQGFESFGDPSGDGKRG